MEQVGWVGFVGILLPVLIAIGGAMAWLWSQLSSKVSKDEFTSGISRIEAAFEKAERHADESRRDIYALIRQSVEHQADTNVEVSNALGELRGELARRRR